MSYIRFERIWEDYDKMVQILISSSNGSYSCSQDIYIYPEEIMTFGEQLKIFPQSLEEDVVLAYGSDDPKVYAYLHLRACTYNRAGHVALEIKTDNHNIHKKAYQHASTHFFVACEATVLNKLGRALCAWTNDMSQPLELEWDTSEL